MKKLLISSIATLGLLGTSASAADMAVKASPPAPVAAPWSWTGFYVGVNAGGSIGRNTTNNNTQNISIPAGENLPESFTVSPAGFAGGGQIGYNWQFSPNWLFGVEGDVQGLDQKETTTTGSSELVTTQQQDWFVTARARFGYTNGDWLWYVTGGGAWGNIKQTCAFLAAPGGPTLGSVSNSTTNSGWTVGGGVETHLWGNWTAKAEYLYLDLGSISGGPFIAESGDIFAFTVNTHVHDHIVRVGINYKWGADNGYAAYAVPSAPHWGPSVQGAACARRCCVELAGGSIGRNTTNNNFVMGENFPESFTVSPAGFAGGGQIGYNWQFSPSWLFGVEGDVQGLDQKETAFTSLMNSLQRSSKTGSRRRALGSDTLTAIGYGTSPAAAPGETSSRPLA
jgi:outer membrane immunogenic protein